MFRISATLALFLAGAVTAIWQLVQGDVWIAATSLVGGVAAGLGVFPWNYAWAARAVAGVMGGFALFALIHDHRAFNSDLQLAQQMVTLVLVAPDLPVECRTRQAEMMRRKAFGLCGTATYTDMGSAAADMASAVHLGPASGTAMGAYETVKELSRDVEPPRCATTFKALYVHCPGAFVGMRPEHVNALLMDAED